MNKLILFIILSTISCTSEINNFDKALVSFSDYESLVQNVKEIRAKRLINYDQFLQHQKEANTYVLDARSKERYKSKHIKGAINLPFTEFTQTNLRAIIPDTKSTILIYCNNNFHGDQLNFASKIFNPEIGGKKTMIMNKDSIMMALNIPTFINLMGYGYSNIYELNELLNINDPRLEFQGNNGINTINIAK